MSPKPIIENSKHEYSTTCDCTTCQDARFKARNPHLYGYRDDPLSPARGILIGLGLSLCILIALAGAAIIWAKTVQAREGTVHPIAAPEALLRARQACPNGSTLVECRGELRKAYAAVEWQRHARWGAKASTSRDVVLDAINWASEQTGVPAWRLANIARCESHLFFLAHNGQYLGVWQLGATHRSDPIFDVVPWMDPYAQAIHVARFIKAHGESQWQCSSAGGLRW